MGYEKQRKLEASDERKAKNARAADNRASRRLTRGLQAPADWSTADPAAVLDLVVRVTKSGGLVSFAKTRDGGALVLTVWVDGEKYQDYVRPSDDLGRLIDDVRATFQTVSDPGLE